MPIPAFKAYDKITFGVLKPRKFPSGPNVDWELKLTIFSLIVELVVNFEYIFPRGFRMIRDAIPRSEHVSSSEVIGITTRLP